MMHRSPVFANVALFSVLRLLGHFTDPSLSNRQVHEILGEPVRASAEPPPGQELKVVTWNIQRGVEFDRVLDALDALDADIYLLQEVDMFCRRSGRRHVAKDLADALGVNWVYAGEFQEIGESSGRGPALTGQAVLSRYPIEEASVIHFRAQARLRWRLSPIEPRRGGRIALRARIAGVLVYDAHIESGGNDRLRRRQLDEILADQASRAGDGSPVLIAGDFNNVPAIRSSMFSRLAAAAFEDALRQDGGPQRTTARHRHPIDWVFIKNLLPKEGCVADIGGASDHYPLLATVVAER